MVDNTLTKLSKIKEEALKNDIPIIKDETANYLRDFILKNNIKNILEIGSAVGYSSLVMATAFKDVKVTTIEYNEERYLEAIKNIKEMNQEKNVNIIFGDATDVVIDDKFDLIFIDAAKAKNELFFNKFKYLLNSGGVIITDNMNFHGYINKNLDEIENKNLRNLVKKIKDYHEFLSSLEDFETHILDIGDGIAISALK